MTRSHAALVGMLIACILCLFFGGCAMLPMPFQPVSQENSNYAEGGFLVLATVDTVQTMHLKPGTACAYEADPLARALYRSRTPPPGRVLVTNLVMITAHTMVASWLDDKVAAESAQYEKDDTYGVGPWMAARFVFHVVSLGAETSAVLNNYNHGCKL